MSEDPLRQRARDLLDQADSRGRVKRLAEQLATEDALRRAVWEEGRARGVALDEEALTEWPADRLLRRARGREADAQVRTNPIRRDEGFVCAHCGAEVPPLGHTDRDHCPRCLRSRHVDEIPGDRASRCGGIMDPVGAELVGGTLAIRYRCRACGHAHRVKAIRDGEAPDDWDVVIRVSAGELPP